MTRIVNFANILKYDYIPLAELINELLIITKDALGSPVEIEWAVDLTKTQNKLPSFYLLQIKPLVSSQQNDEILSQKVGKRNYTFYTLMHGIIQHDLYHLGQIILTKQYV